jgi:hypothetical protein
MATHKNTWKASERRVADKFGTKRNPLSGGNSGVTRSDTRHSKLFIESKYRKRHAVIKLYNDTAKLAKLENKVPLVALFEKGKPGFWLLLKEEDLKTIANEYMTENNNYKFTPVPMPTPTPLDIVIDDIRYAVDNEPIEIRKVNPPGGKESFP